MLSLAQLKTRQQDQMLGLNEHCIYPGVDAKNCIKVLRPSTRQRRLSSIQQREKARACRKMSNRTMALASLKRDSPSSNAAMSSGPPPAGKPTVANLYESTVCQQRHVHLCTGKQSTSGGCSRVHQKSNKMYTRSRWRFGGRQHGPQRGPADLL